MGLVWFLPQVPVQTRSSLWGTCVGKVWVLETGASISFHLPGTAWSSSTHPTRPWTDHSQWRDHVPSIVPGCPLSHTGCPRCGCNGWRGWT